MRQGDRSSSPEFQSLVDQIADECLAIRVRVLSRVITSIYDEALRPHGLRITQLNILVATASVGTARPADLCRLLAMDASSLSRTLDRLASHGWIEFVPDVDGRARPFRLTAAGRDILVRAYPAWKAAQHRAREQLGEQLAALLTQAFPITDRSTS